MAKFKLNLSAFDIHSASSWVGAFSLAVLIIGSVYGGMQFFAEKYNAKQMVEPSPENLAKLFESVPANTTPESVDFTAVGESSESQASPSPVANKVVGNPYRDWGYFGESGPKFWSLLSTEFKLCNKGKEQSPIDLSSSSSKGNSQISSLRFFYDPIAGELNNDGRGMQFVVERGNTLLAFNQTFKLDHVDIRIPAEHLIDGKKYDAELQFFHKGANGGRLNLAVLAKESTTNHSELQKLIQNIPTGRDRPVAVESMKLDRLLPGGEDYFYYDGSLTEPPCQEHVRWVVMKSPIAISAQQIDRILTVSKFNARPVQDVAGRNVFRSW